MSSREFVDSQGRAWRVWSTVPTTRSMIAAGYAEGWLTFESATELRRFTPIPEGWEGMSDAGLATLCSRATPAPRRSKPVARQQRPPETDAPRA